MTLPADVATLRLGTWNRRKSDSWSDFSFRAQVVDFLDAFVDLRSWASSWIVTERFATSNINVKIPRTLPVQEAELEDFKQRDGVRILVVVVVRVDQAELEVATSFPNGPGTTPAALAKILDLAGPSIDALNRTRSL